MITALSVAWAGLIVTGAGLVRPRIPTTRLCRPDQRPRGVRPWALLPATGIAVAVAVWPWAGAALTAGGLVAGAAASRRSRLQRARSISRELPEAIEILRVCAEGGLTVRSAVESASEITSGELAGSLAAASRAAAAGAALDDALESATAHIGPAVRPLVSALAASERYGVALVPSLDRLAIEARNEERRRGEADARRVPVKLLFPLVLLILPAFALLTVAPLIAGGLEPLRLP